MPKWAPGVTSTDFSRRSRSDRATEPMGSLYLSNAIAPATGGTYSKSSP